MVTIYESFEGYKTIKIEVTEDLSKVLMSFIDSVTMKPTRARDITHELNVTKITRSSVYLRNVRYDNEQLAQYVKSYIFKGKSIVQMFEKYTVPAQ